MQKQIKHNNFAITLFFFSAVIGTIISMFIHADALAYYEISDGSVKALYHFLNDGVDSSGNGYNLSNVGGTYVTGKLNKAVDFDGSSHYMTGTNHGIGSGDFTIAYWINYDTFQNYIGEVSTTRGANGFNAGTQALGECVWYANSAERLRCTSDPYTVDVWHFVVYKRESGTLSVYRDNVLIDSASDSINYSATTFDLGSTLASDNSHSEFLNGMLDEVVLVNRALTTNEMTALYNAGSGQEVCVTLNCAASNTSGTSTTTDETSEAIYNSFATFVMFAMFGIGMYLGYKLVKRR